MEPTTVAQGQGQGQAYIWKPDNATPMRMYQMGQIAALNQARLNAAKKAREDKAREDMEAAALKPGEVGFYQRDWDEWDGNWKKNAVSSKVPLTKDVLYERERRLATNKANNEILKDFYNKVQSDPLYDPDFVMPKMYEGIRTQKDESTQVARPERVINYTLDNWRAYRPQKIGEQIEQSSVGTRSSETGNRLEQTTIKRSSILKEDGTPDVDEMKKLALGNPFGKRFLESYVKEKTAEAATLIAQGATPQEQQAIAQQAADKATREGLSMIFPETMGLYEKSVRFGAIPAAKKPSDSEKFGLQIITTSTPIVQRIIKGEPKKLADGRTEYYTDPVSKETMREAQVPAVNLSGRTASAMKKLAQNLIATGTKVRPIGLIEQKETGPTANKPLNKTINYKDGKEDKTITLERAYKQGEVITEKDAKLLAKARQSYNAPSKKNKAVTTAFLDQFVQNPGTVNYTMRPFAKETIVDGKMLYMKDDELPADLLEKLKPSQYEIESGFDLIPLEYQQGVTTTTTDPYMFVTKSTKDNLSAPKINKLGRVFVRGVDAGETYADFLRELRKNGQTIEQVESKLSEMAGYPTATKTGFRAYLNTKKKQAAPKTFKHD
jgi:hypothetical protein